jgi:predicted DNA-binding protein
MRVSHAVKPSLFNLTHQHKKVLSILRQRTNKTMTNLVKEAIEDLAAKYRLVQEGNQIHDWPDWD